MHRVLSAFPASHSGECDPLRAPLSALRHDHDAVQISAPRGETMSPLGHPDNVIELNRACDSPSKRTFVG